MNKIIKEVTKLAATCDCTHLHTEVMESMKPDAFADFLSRRYATSEEYLAGYLLFMAEELGPKFEDGWQPVRDFVKAQALSLKAAETFPKLYNRTESAGIVAQL